jgi:hypothetical protein
MNLRSTHDTEGKTSYIFYNESKVPKISEFQCSGTSNINLHVSQDVRELVGREPDNKLN